MDEHHASICILLHLQPVTQLAEYHAHRQKDKRKAYEVHRADEDID